MPSEDLLSHLKHCQLRPEAPTPFSSNAPFFVQDFRFLYVNDWPPSARFPHSLKFPTIWTLGGLRRMPFNRSIFRHNTLSAPFPLIAGGAHLTSFAFLPALIYKELLNAEGGLVFFRKAHQGGVSLGSNPRSYYDVLQKGPRGDKRLVPFRGNLPWIIAQNQDQFPWLFLS